MADPYEFLAGYYGVSEQSILDCVDRTYDLLGDDSEIDPNDIAKMIAFKIQDITSPRNLFDLMRVVVSASENTEFGCDETSVTLHIPQILDLYHGEDGSGIVDINISIYTPLGESISIKVYRGILDEFDPFETEPRISIDIDNMDFLNGEIVDWNIISPEAQSAISGLPGLKSALIDREADVVVAELISFGRYIWNQC
jgi:hypothetical protein